MTDPMTSAQLEELRRLSDKVTPGPWTLDEEAVRVLEEVLQVAIDYSRIVYWANNIPQPDADASIEAARALLDKLRAQSRPTSESERRAREYETLAARFADSPGLPNAELREFYEGKAAEARAALAAANQGDGDAGISSPTSDKAG